ncbi:MAG: PipX family protein [Limnothrix sp.]
MNTESYFNHPTFGMLFLICKLEGEEELFTTLYAQRLFFSVQNSGGSMVFDPITRMDARMKVEQRLRQVRRYGTPADLQKLQALYKRTFQ